MNGLQIYQRLEILFWKKAVAFVQNMKRVRRTSIVMVFIFFSLVLCLLTFATLNTFQGTGTLALLSKKVLVLGDNYYDRDYPKQHNTLLILVDDLKTKAPHLEGLWLAVSQVETLKTYLIPVYPSIKDGNTSLDINISSSFGLKVDGNPKNELANYLESKGIWWETVLVLDRTIVHGLVEQLGERPVLGYSTYSYGRTSIKLQDPINTLLSQIEVLDIFCKRSQIVMQMLLSDVTSTSRLGHRITNLPGGLVTATQDRLFDYGGGVSCEFPTFSGYIADNNEQ